MMFTIVDDDGSKISSQYLKTVDLKKGYYYLER